MHRILVSDPLNPLGLELLRESGAEVVELAPEDRSRLPEILPGFDALVVRSMTKVTAEVLRAGRGLKVVGRAGIGVDNVDVKTATELGILVVNAPTANLLSATEHTFALLLALARNMPAADASLKAGEWDRKRFVGVELDGKSLGVVGFGRIGQQVAARARAFGMEVLAFDPFLDPEVAHRLEVELLSLEDLLPRVDILTLHVPFSEQTRNLISRDRLASMKAGALLINCARGGVVDEEALIEALDSGHLAGAAVDVFAQEPPEDFKLAGHPKVVGTPHIGAQTREAQERISTETAKMLLAALDGSLAITAVNLPFRSAGHRAEPYLRLGEELGKLASGLAGGSLRRLQVDLWGIDDELRQPISIAALRGGLEPFLGESVNYVNAEKVAESRGIEVVRATHSEAGIYPHLVGVTWQGDAGEVEIAGTLIGGKQARVVRFRGFPLEFRPEGKLLVVRNRDVPGVVGKIGGLLGEAEINIVDIHLARLEGEENAMAVLRLGCEPAAEVLERLKAFPEVADAQLVNLGSG